MINEKAIIIKGLCKEYYKKDASHGGFFAKFKLNKSGKPFLALNNINLEINKGEVIGIIGPNGAGKSTLLKILAEVTPPTTGSVEIFGKVASILEIGIGFQPELSGYENIFLSGKLYGLNNKQIYKKLDEIIDLFGFKDFIHSEVKHYSSGMYMRLAFAIIVHIDADIYLFDEILSVGDFAFQNKVLKVISNLKEKKSTILIVTHSPATILSISDYFIILKDNCLISKATPISALTEYQELVLYNKSNFEKIPQHFSIKDEEISKKINLKKLSDNIQVDLLSAEICNLEHSSNDVLFSNQMIEIKFCLKYKTNQALSFGFTVKNYNSVIITHHMYVADLKCDSNEHTINLETIIPPNKFNNFNLKIDFFVIQANELILLYQNILQFDLISADQNIYAHTHQTIGYMNINNLNDKITHI